MDVILVIVEGSLLSRHFLLQRMVALSLWNIVCSRYFCYSNGWEPCHYRTWSIVDIFVTLMAGSLVIMEHSLLSRFWLLQRMVALSLWNIVCCRYFFTLMDCCLVMVEGGILSIFLFVHLMVALSLWKVVCC